MPEQTFTPNVEEPIRDKVRTAVLQYGVTPEQVLASVPQGAPRKAAEEVLAELESQGMLNQQGSRLSDARRKPVEEPPRERLSDIDRNPPRTYPRLAEDVAFSTAVLADAPNPLALYDQVYATTLRGGTHPVTEEMRQNISQDQNRIVDGAIEATITDESLSPQERLVAIASLDSSRKTAGEVSLSDAASEKLAEDSVIYASPETVDQAEMRWRTLEDALEKRKELEEVIGQTLLEELDVGAVELVGEVAGVVVTPTLEGKAWAGVAAELFGEDFKQTCVLLPGNCMDRVRTWFRGLPIDEQIKEAPRVIRAFRNVSGYLGENEFQAYTMVHDTLMSGYVEGDTDWDKILLNIGGILDVAALGVTTRTGRQLWRGSRAEKTLRENSERATELLAAATMDSQRRVAGVLQVTPETIAQVTSVPKPLADIPEILTNGPSGVADIIQRAEDISRDILSRSNSTLSYKTDELAGADDIIVSKLTDLTGVKLQDGAVSISDNRSALIATDDFGNFYVRARYGVDNNYGFRSASEALEAGLEHFPRESITLEIRRADSVSDELYEVREVAGGMEYLDKGTWKPVDFEGDYFFTTVDRFTTQDVFSTAPLGVATDDFRITGAKAAWAMPEHSFSRWITQSAEVARDQSKTINKQILDIIREPFLKLDFKRQHRVIDSLRDGSTEMRTFTPDILEARYHMDAMEQRAYYSVRSMFDVMHTLNDVRWSKKLAAEGNKVFDVDGLKGIGKQLDEITARDQARTVYNPRTGEIIDLAEVPNMIRDLYARGGSVVRSMDDFKVKGAAGGLPQKTRYMIAEADSSFFNAIPATGVLKKIPGYIPRMYSGTYFVRRVEDAIENGVKTKSYRHLHAVHSQRDAEKLVRDLNKTGVTHDYKIAREFDANTLDVAEFEHMVTTGRLFFSKRGEHLNGVEGMADVRNPVEAMINSVNTISRHVAMDEVIGVHKRRFLTSFKDSIRDTTSGKAAWSSNLQAMAKPDTDAVTKARMQAYHDYISLLDNSRAADAVTEASKAALIKMSDYVAGLGVPATVAENIRDFALIRSLRSMAFTTQLALNPLRQLVIQGQQSFFFLGPAFPKYVYTGAMYKDFTALSMGMMAIDNKSLWDNFASKVGSKMMGVTPKEYQRLVQEFRNSGLPYAVDSNTLVQGLAEGAKSDVARSTLGRAVNAPVDLAKEAIKFARVVGFDAGEYVNISTTWLVARHKFMRDMGRAPTSKRDWDTVAADARGLSLSMVDVASAKYQQGALSAFMQYFSVQHKALGVALRGTGIKKFEALGSDVFTPQMARRILIGQLAFFGMAGVGLHEAYEYAKDKLGVQLPDDVDMAVRGGLVDWVVNSILQEFDTGDKDTRIMVSETFATGGGILNTVSDFFQAALSEDGFNTLDFIGPSGDVVSKLYRTAKELWQVRRIPTIDSEQKAEILIKSFLSLGSGYSNYLQGEIAQQIGFYVDKYQNNPTIRATYLEAQAKGLFGVPSYAESEYYSLKRTVGGAGHFDTVDNDIANDARAVASVFNKLVTTYSDMLDEMVGETTGDISDEEALRRLDMIQSARAHLKGQFELEMGQHMILMSGYNPLAQEKFNSEFAAALREMPIAQEELIRKAVNLIYGTDRTGSFDEFITNRLSDSGIHDISGYKDAIEGIRQQLFLNEEQANALYEESK